MKNIIRSSFALSFLFIIGSVFAQQYHYYYNNQKVFLDTKPDHYVVTYKEGTEKQTKEIYLQEKDASYDKDNLERNLIRFSSSQLEDNVRKISEYSGIKSVASILTDKQGHELSVSGSIIVKFNESVAENIINMTAASYNLHILNSEWIGEQTYLFSMKNFNESKIFDTIDNILNDSNV